MRPPERILADVVESNGDRYVVDVNQTANLGGVDGAVDLYEQAIVDTLENGSHA